MTKLMISVLAAALSMSVIAWGQSQNDNQSRQAGQNQTQSQNTNQGQAQHMSGTVSRDGKTVTSNNQTYTVGNPDALQNYAGQPVALVVHVDPDSNVIHILTVTPAQ